MKRGNSHEYSDSPIKLGWLYDELEARMLRGCGVEITMFPNGCKSADDPSSSSDERVWAHRADTVNSIWTSQIFYAHPADLPRLRIRSWQVWPGGGPGLYQKFDVREKAWRYLDHLPSFVRSEIDPHMYDQYKGDGCTWLVMDCKRDTVPDLESATWRWSKSEAAEPSRLEWTTGRG